MFMDSIFEGSPSTEGFHEPMELPLDPPLYFYMASGNLISRNRAKPLFLNEVTVGSHIVEGTSPDT